MYIKEIVREMEHNHHKSLQAHQIMATVCDEYLLPAEIPNSTLVDVSLFHLTKFHKSLLSLRLLVVSGMEEDSIVILRTMIEATIGLVYISREPDKRVQLFVEYSAILRNKKLIATLKHYPDENIFDEDTINEIKEDRETYKINYNKHGWSGESLFDMAKNADMEFWYDMFYQSDSSYVHTNISASSKLMYYDEEEMPVVCVGPRSFNAIYILTRACEITRIILLCALTNMAKDPRKLEKAWLQAKKLLDNEIACQP